MLVVFYLQFVMIRNTYPKSPYPCSDVICLVFLTTPLGWGDDNYIQEVNEENTKPHLYR